jgi:hypothetical protein
MKIIHINNNLKCIDAIYIFTFSSFSKFIMLAYNDVDVRKKPLEFSTIQMEWAHALVSRSDYKPGCLITFTKLRILALKAQLTISKRLVPDLPAPSKYRLSYAYWQRAAFHPGARVYQTILNFCFVYGPIIKNQFSWHPNIRHRFSRSTQGSTGPVAGAHRHCGCDHALRLRACALTNKMAKSLFAQL